MAEPLAGIVTVFGPVASAAAKSPLWRTVRFTVRPAARFAPGAGLACTVNSAAVPSVTGDVAGSMVTMGRQAGRSLTSGGSMTSFLCRFSGRQVRLLSPR